MEWKQKPGTCHTCVFNRNLPDPDDAKAVFYFCGKYPATNGAPFWRQHVVSKWSSDNLPEIRPYKPCPEWGQLG